MIFGRGFNSLGVYAACVATNPQSKRVAITLKRARWHGRAVKQWMFQYHNYGNKISYTLLTPLPTMRSSIIQISSISSFDFYTKKEEISFIFFHIQSICLTEPSALSCEERRSFLIYFDVPTSFTRTVNSEHRLGGIQSNKARFNHILCRNCIQPHIVALSCMLLLFPGVTVLFEFLPGLSSFI